MYSKDVSLTVSLFCVFHAWKTFDLFNLKWWKSLYDLWDRLITLQFYITKFKKIINITLLRSGNPNYINRNFGNKMVSNVRKTPWKMQILHFCYKSCAKYNNHLGHFLPNRAYSSFYMLSCKIMYLQKDYTLTIKLYPYKCLNMAMNRQTGHSKWTKKKSTQRNKK